MKQVVPASLVTYPKASRRINLALPFSQMERKDCSVNSQPFSSKGLMSIWFHGTKRVRRHTNCHLYRAQTTIVTVVVVIFAMSTVRKSKGICNQEMM
jgi:hypothetical protein